ncbi:MAG TPA: CYCXC family (seleno)protein [Terriglobales bacterium]|nr:CYCXC family (seleno)protein [Terriglobales bacterium]
MRAQRLHHDSRRAGWIVVLAILGMVLIGTVVFFARQRSGLPPMNLSRRPIPPYYDRIERALPLPQTLRPDLFSRPDVIRAYSVAKRIPAVLVQQPCYCGCHRVGHRSLLACFTSDHAVNCRICLQEAILADNLEGQGKDVAYIRRSIIAGEWWGIKLE